MSDEEIIRYIIHMTGYNDIVNVVKNTIEDYYIVNTN